MSGQWRVDTQDWLGQTCFIVGGGASLLKHDVNVLRGRNVIVINTSYETVPWADYLIFSDSRWWWHHQSLVKEFRGKIISASPSVKGPPPVLKMHRKNPPGLATDIGTLTIKNTTLSAAVNLAVHLGVNRIVLLGIDGKPQEDGRTHHHKPHPWKMLPGCWDRQYGDLDQISIELKERGIECVNASPGSAWPHWPIVELSDYVGHVRDNHEAHAAAVATCPA